VWRSLGILLPMINLLMKEQRWKSLKITWWISRSLYRFSPVFIGVFFKSGRCYVSA
jgi:hypothetical protein